MCGRSKRGFTVQSHQTPIPTCRLGRNYLFLRQAQWACFKMTTGADVEACVSYDSSSDASSGRKFLRATRGKWQP